MPELYTIYDQAWPSNSFLYDQACPSNSFLFHLDVEEGIKYAAATKLKGFVAMKTRPINNNRSKWSNQATSKNKPIIEWIKQGENNRAALERLEKRYRDWFRNEAYKKP